MPTIPRYPSERIDQAPIPGARLSEGAPLEAFGGNNPAPGAAASLAGGATRILAQQAEEEKQKADQTAVLDAATKLSALGTDLLYNPDTGALNQRGKNAFGVPKKVMEDYQKGANDIAGALKTDEQRLAFQRQIVSHSAEINRAVQSHVAGEIKAYDLQTVKGYVETEQNAAIAAYNDPERVEMALARQQAALTDAAKRHGIPKEYADLISAETVSKTSAKVVDAMLANGQDLAAKNYFETHRDRFQGDDALSVAKAVEQGSYLGSAQRAVDFIFAPSFLDGRVVKGAETMDDVRKESSKIEDPKLRRMVEDLARERISDIKRDEHQRAMDSYEAAARLVDANPNKKPEMLVSPGEWAKMPAEYRDALNKRNLKEMDDSKAWLAWMDFARDHMAAAALPKADFEAQYWANLNPTHREQAIKEWQSAGEAASKAGSKLTEYKSLYSDRDMILNALRSAQIADIDASDTMKTIEEDEDKRKALVDYTDRIEQAFAQHFADNGKMPDDARKKQIVADTILPEKEVKIYQKWWFDPKRKVKELSDEEIKKVESGYEDIPAHSIDTMLRKANSYGLKLDPENSSDDKIRLARAFIASIRHKNDLVKSILSGKE